MRYGLLILGIAVCIGLYQGWFALAYDHATSAALSEDAREAIDVRCQALHGRAARECRSMLKKLYLAGALDPDKTLRTYCDSVKSARWGGSRPDPPEVCVERYGGWPGG
jgi:hypothetical protein